MPFFQRAYQRLAGALQNAQHLPFPLQALAALGRRKGAYQGAVPMHGPLQRILRQKYILAAIFRQQKRKALARALHPAAYAAQELRQRPFAPLGLHQQPFIRHTRQPICRFIPAQRQHFFQLRLGNRRRLIL